MQYNATKGKGRSDETRGLRSHLFFHPFIILSMQIKSVDAKIIVDACKELEKRARRTASAEDHLQLLKDALKTIRQVNRLFSGAPAKKVEVRKVKVTV